MEEDVKVEEVEQVTTDSESSTEEKQAPAVQQEVEADPDKEIAEELLKESESKEKEESSDEDKAEEPVEETPEEEQSEDTEEPVEPPKKGAESRKEDLQNEIRGLVAKKNQLRDEIADLNNNVYRAQTAEELVDQGYDPTTARVEALEQESQMTKFNNHVADVNANLNIESLQVMSDFPVFNPDAPEYDKALADRASQMYEKVSGIVTDPKTGLIIDAKVLPYDFYKNIAEVAQRGKQEGSISGQKAAEKNIAAADPVSSSVPAPVEDDPFLKGLSGN